MAETIVLKTCTKCKTSKPATPEYFYRHNRKDGRGDGLYPQCKICKDAYRKTPKGREVVLRKTEKWRRSTEAGKVYSRAKEQRRRTKHPERYHSRTAVAYAIRCGGMPPVHERHCAMCEAQANDYHHWSYDSNHWLDVIPLCRQCHNKLHRMGKDRRYKVEMRLRDMPKAA